MSIQIHLWFSHAAAVGAIGALIVLLVAHRTRHETIFQMGYGFVLATAIIAAVAYFSGPEAYELLEQLEPALETAWIEDHAVIGRFAFVVLVLVGVLDLGALMQYLQGEVPSRLQRLSILGGLIAAAALLIWASHLGGLIRHPEIRSLF